MSDSKPTWLGTSDRYARLRRIEQLDLATEHREIALLFYGDFQSSMLTKGFCGFMFNNAATRISSVLAHTGELEKRVAKRVVDTTLLAGAVMSHGFKEGPGRDAARRVNAMHSRYDINPDDFVAVAVEEILGSIDLAERHGWREVTDKEREALRLYYAHQARAFGGSKPLPDSIQGVRDFFETYLQRDVYYAPHNERLARALLAWYDGMVPAWARTIFRTMLMSEIDPRVARACGLRPPSPLARSAAQALLHLNGRKDPLPDGTPSKFVALVRSVYPNGYGTEDLGTPGHAKGPEPA